MKTVVLVWVALITLPLLAYGALWLGYFVARGDLPLGNISLGQVAAAAAGGW